MHPMIKEYVSILIKDKMWKHGDVATGKLLAMSAGTVKNRVRKLFESKKKRKRYFLNFPITVETHHSNISWRLEYQTSWNWAD